MQGCRCVTGDGQSVCMTRQCVTAASTLLQALDDSVDPCNDFYQYACGGWIKANTIPPGESRWDTFGVLRRKNQLVIKNLFGKSMNIIDTHGDAALCPIHTADADATQLSRCVASAP